jgi:uncharacterized protein (TIGR02145 family)
MKKKNNLLIYLLSIMVLLLILTNSCKKDEDNNNNPPPDNTVTDIDGNVYHIITIGTQVWMVENLRVTRYRNGDPIPNVTDAKQWELLKSGGYCIYDNNSANSSVYGFLYNWYAVSDTHNLAPTGWHIPTDLEWTTLTTFLGGENVAGGKLKETDTIHWMIPNKGATNETGFTALPGGIRNFMGAFTTIRDYGGWWSSTKYETEFAYYRYITFNAINTSRFNCIKSYGLSVRCLKDY